MFNIVFMKKTFHDEYEERDFEVEIPDDIYRKAYEQKDYDALYEVGIILETETEISMAVVADIMEEAYADGEGSQDAYEWLLDYRSDDGRFDAWS